MNIVQLAGALPRDPQFIAFVCEIGCADVVTEEHAAEFIRRVCGVKSRRELGNDELAAWKFEALVRRPFVAWREKQKEAA